MAKKRGKQRGKQTHTVRGTPKYGELRRQLGSIGAVSSLAPSDDYVYIHNYYSYFNLGYSSVAKFIERQVTMISTRIKSQVSSLLPKALNAEKEVYAALGIKNIDELNKLYTIWTTSGSNKNVNQAFSSMIEYKNSRVDTWLEKDSTETLLKKDAALEQIQKSLQKVIEEELTLNGDSLLDNKSKEAIASILKAESKYSWLEAKLGTAMEPIVHKLLSDGIDKDIGTVLRYYDKEQKTNTHDLGLKLNKLSWTANISLKTGVGINPFDGTRTNILSVGRGAEKKKEKDEFGKKKTVITNSHYNIANLKSEYDKIDPKLFGLIKYVIYNHKVLNNTKFVLDTLQILRYSIAWINLMSGIFGTGFDENSNITDFSIFLASLEDLISISSMLKYIKNLNFKDIKKCINKQTDVDRFLTQNTPARNKMKGLKQDKSVEIKENNQIPYSELRRKVEGQLEDINEILSKDLQYRIQYRIAMNNIKNAT